MLIPLQALVVEDGLAGAEEHDVGSCFAGGGRFVQAGEVDLCGGAREGGGDSVDVF